MDDESPVRIPGRVHADASWLFWQKNVPSFSTDPAFLRMIMTQVLRHAVTDPVSADFTVRRGSGVAGRVCMYMRGWLVGVGGQGRCLSRLDVGSRCMIVGKRIT